MDPKAALDGLFMAVNSQDWDMAREAIDALEGWQKNGGFMPTIHSVDADIP